MVTHGSVAVLVRYLREKGLDAQGFTTEYGDEEDDAPAKPDAVEEAAS
jgi:putative mRNA 3-end processing factor